MSYNSAALLGGEHMLPRTEAERQRMIADLKLQYADTLRKYGEYLATYPYTVEKAKLYSDRALKRAMKQEAKARRQRKRKSPSSHPPPKAP